MNPIRLALCSLFLVSSVWARPMFPAATIISPFPGLVNEMVTFMSTATSSDNSALTYSWDFDDGATATGQVVSHTFSSVTSYYVHLHVTDATGSADDYISMPIFSTATYSLCGYTKGKGVMTNFVAQGKDSMTLSGVMPSTPQFTFASGMPLTFVFAGAPETFTMSSVKSGKNADGSKISLTLPRQPGGAGKFSVTLKKKNFYSTFRQAGYIYNPNIRVAQVGIETMLLYNGTQVGGMCYINVTLPKTKPALQKFASVIPTPGLTVSSNGTPGEQTFHGEELNQ